MHFKQNIKIKLTVFVYDVKPLMESQNETHDLLIPFGGPLFTSHGPPYSLDHAHRPP